MRGFSSAVSVFVLIAALFQMGCPSSKQPKSMQITIDGNVITEAQAREEGTNDLQALEMKMLEAKASYARDERNILDQAFERILGAKLVGMEAEKRGVTKEELMEAEVNQKVAEPSDAEIDAFYEANKSRISASKEDILPQIRAYLKQREENRIKQEFLAGLEKDHKIVRDLGYLRFDVDAPGLPSEGPAAAPVVLVEFSDFQCTYCRAFSATLKQIMEKYGDKVRMVYRQYPLSNIHPDAERASEASLCAADQDHFWDMYNFFFEDPGNLKQENILKKVEELGMNVQNFQSCLDTGKHIPQIREDQKAGAAAGVQGTPSLFVNGRYFNGNRPYEEIASVIDEELKNAGSPQ
jgi:protein-disulfide isomerase